MEKKRFDCVVIGSGVGGICAAALMAHHGYDVLVVEKRSRLGGRFSTQEIEGCKCATGALIIVRGTELEKTFTATGADFDIVKCTQVAWQIGDKVYAVTGWGAFKSLWDLTTKLPRRLYKYVFMSTLGVFRLMFEILFFKVLNLFRKEEDRVYRRHEENPIMFRDWMKQYTDDEQVMQAAHAFISACFSAINDFECPASDVFAFAASMANPFKPHLTGFARRGNVELVNSLAKTITDRGGTVMKNTEVKKIKLTGNMVTSVVLCGPEGEFEVETALLISNAGPRETMEMVGEQHYPADYVAKMKKTLRPAPIVMGHVVSDVPLMEEKGLVVISGTKTIVGAVNLSLHTPEVAPPGKYLLWTFATPSTCTQKLDHELEIRHNMEDLEKAFPLFKEHGKLIDLEVKDIDADLPCMRSWPGYDMPVTTPFANLYNVGDGVKAFGWTGTPACAKSAWHVVDKIRKNFPVERVRA